MGGTESKGLEPETGSTPQGVTRWRKRPVEVSMILWDGTEEAWQLIANHGGLPDRCTDGSLNIWVEKSQAEMNLDPGAWAILEPDGSGVYPCTAEAQAATYDPASSPDPPKMTVTAGLLRSQVVAALTAWEDEDGTSDPADAVMAAIEPSLTAIAAEVRHLTASEARARAELARLMRDLITVLGEAEGFIGGKDNAAFSRLAAAAGVE